MLFTSLTFLVFLVGSVVLYYAVPQRFRWYVLLAASLIFYAFAGLSHLLYIGTTIITTYAISMQMRRCQLKRDADIKTSPDRESRKQCKALAKALCWKWLLLCLFVNFGILAVIKYTGFVISNVNALLRLWNPGAQLGLLRLPLILGISFYTFQTMGYIIDVYREKTQPETNLLKFALFVSFFPQIIQGPISRHSDLRKTLYVGGPFSWQSFTFGSQRILWGFFKKLIIADRLLPVWNTLVTNPDKYDGAYVLVGMLIYAITLFCDFTGGIDITIGVAEILGVKVTENFDRPFYSTSIAEYWRRWHITMGTWFKDYLFYPLSVSKPMLKLSKNARAKWGEKHGKRVPVYISTLFVWFMTGLWHGATWNFVVWGLANGVVILLSQECQPLYSRFRARFKWTASKGYHVFEIFRMFWLMCFIRSFDCYDGVGTTFRMMGSALTNFNGSRLLSEGVQGLTPPVFIGAGLGLCVVFIVSFIQRNGTDARVWLSQKKWPVRYIVTAALFFMIIIFGAYGLGYDARQFIYNQF